MGHRPSGEHAASAPACTRAAVEALPVGPGTYAVVFRACDERAIAVGRLGRLPLRPGWYVYVGSALGPGGLSARVGRHLRGGSVRRWHVDFLRAVADPLAVWATVDPVAREHDWAAILLELPGAKIPLPRFGASDCRCPAHLVFFPTPPRRDRFARRLRCAHPGHGPVCAHAARG